MNPPGPPPLPTEPPWRAYVRTCISLIPAFAAWLFSSYFLAPRLEVTWDAAGLTNSRAQWLVSVSDGFRTNLLFIVAGLIVLFVCLEVRVRSWKRIRRPTLFAATVMLNAAVYIWVLSLATAALLAAPLALKNE